MALQCQKSIYFEGQSSLAHFYVPINQVHTNIQTRQTESNCMVVPHTRTAVGSKAFSVRGPSFWNSLLRDLRLNESFNSFKSIISKSAETMFENLLT